MAAQELRDLSPDELLELMEMQRKIASIDFDQLERERQARLTPRENLLRKMNESGTKGRITKVKKRGPGRPKTHWKRKKRIHREYMRKYMSTYNEVGGAKRRALRGKYLEDGDWYGYIELGWRKNATKSLLTREEWEGVIAGKVGDRKPVIYRYDKNEPISLYNIVVKDSDTRSVLFDGKEQLLVDSGYAVEQ